MKIYTRSGDKGETALLSGNRVGKNHIRIEAYGSIDELSSYIGYLRGYKMDSYSESTLVDIQKVLFTMSSILALDENKKNIKINNILQKDIDLLEKEIDIMNESLPKLTKFIIPGGNKIVGLTHICRTVCRRCERNIVGMAAEIEIDNIIIQYLNRLSDFLFVLSRHFAQDNNHTEIEI